MNNAQAFLFLLLCILNWWAGFSFSHGWKDQTGSGEKFFFLFMLPAILQGACIVALFFNLMKVLGPLL